MPLLSHGFRPFFLLATVWGAMAMALWTATLRGALTLPLAGLPPTQWHAHELLFGLTHAVIAGFLLTAVSNWTGRVTAAGPPLAGLAALWATARVLLAVGDADQLPLAAAADLTFDAGLLLAVARPVVAARQWRQAGILAKVALLLAANAAFYAGAAGWWTDGARLGVYGALYLVLGLVITIASRVVPFFLRSALPDQAVGAAPAWSERLALGAFLVLFVADVFVVHEPAARVAAAALTALHAWRLAGWTSRAALRRSLLAVLLTGYAWLVVGFALRATAGLTGVAPALTLHAWTAGGMGVMMLGMITRVSLGHTGRDVRAHRTGLGGVFVVASIAAAARVFGPWWSPTASLTAWTFAGLAWTAAWAAVALWGLRLWTTPRLDAA